MNDEKRPYRKNMTAHGLIFLGEEELQIAVKNLSITGLFAEFNPKASSYTPQQLLLIIKESPIIDIYLAEMHMMGTAEIVRTDLVDDHIELALEFRDITHNIDNKIFKPKAYRKNMTAPGQIIFNDIKYQFFTKNVSVDGLMISLKEHIDIMAGTVTIFDFHRLKLRGEIQVAWIEHLNDGSTLMGLYYINMKKDSITSIPRFVAPT